jgi:membrane protease YdiL (CAAX protease family)
LDLTSRLAAWLTLVGAIAALGYAGRLTEGKPPEDTLYRYETAIGIVLVNAIVLGLALLIARRRSKRELFALHRPASWPAALGLGFGIFIGVNLVLLALEPVLHAGREQGLTPPDWEPDHAGIYALNGLAITTVVPTTEELLYRGLGFSLLRPFGTIVAIVVVGLTFALAHGVIAGLPVFVLLGVGLAYLRSRTNSVYPCIVLHAAFNALAVVAVPLTAD